jgi:pantothenate kinase
MTFDDLVARVSAYAGRPGTSIIGIAGAPGAGKSTLAESLVTTSAALLGAGVVAHVPMDGFHLADVVLRGLGRLERKGAPDTFDASGYAALLRRITAPRDTTVYAPAFERDLEQPIAGALAIDPEVRVVVTEGNYLLLADPAWRAVAAEIDEIWFLRIDEDIRLRRLVERHIRFGKTPDSARRWVRDVDEPNARLIEASSVRADLVMPAQAVSGW